MRRSSGRGTYRRFRQPRGAPFRNHHAVRARRKSRSNNRAEVLRILHAIQQHKQSRCRRIRSGMRGQKFFERDSRFRGDQSDNTLMIASSRGAIHLRTFFESHRHAIAPRQADDFLQAIAMPPS